MLIRWATKLDKQDWVMLSKEVDPIFQNQCLAQEEEFDNYMERKLSKYEALVAVDRMTNNCLGIIAFSRSSNCISWLGVFEKHRRKGIGTKLIKCALNNLDHSKEVTVDTFKEECELGIPARSLYKTVGFVEMDNTITNHLGNTRCKMRLAPSNAKKGYSFHHQYPQYEKWTNERNCPVCQNMEAPIKPVLISEMDYAWLECFQEAQGCLFGKCHLLSKVHSNHFYDLSKEDMFNFMSDVQKAAKALHQVTGAVKINYEIHGNTLPHLHVHLFPRYLDDQFPGAGIDVKLTEPSPYESDEEFKWFIESMRKLLT